MYLVQYILLAMLNFYNFFTILNYIYAYFVSNIVSHNTRYALITAHNSECWPIDGLIRNILPQ
jgi:hypothetical protein